MLDLVAAPALDREALLARFVEAAPPPVLARDDFAQSAAAVEDVVVLHCSLQPIGNGPAGTVTMSG